jgi:hypothetical protein
MYKKLFCHAREIKARTRKKTELQTRKAEELKGKETKIFCDEEKIKEMKNKIALARP